MRNAIRKHMRDFLAIIAVVALAVLVGGYILSRQRVYVPGWVPVLGKDYFTLKGEFTTAQAVTPGQGQTIAIAGVPVGEITNVALVDGRAIVTTKVERKYSEIYPDATMLLRPKTSLKDMVVQLDPGSPSSGKRVEDGFMVTSEHTQPDVNLDEVLAVLDADTRDYLRMLLSGAATGLAGQGDELGQLLRRFEPMARYTERFTSLLARRRHNISRAMHNFGTFAHALGDRDDELSRFVDGSAATLRRFAAQDASLQETLELLPGTVDQTRRTLTKVDGFARQLGPALEALQPAAANLAPALRATRPLLRESTPIIRDQLRPFTRVALPVVKTLRPTARQVADATPDLTVTFRELNALLNMLAYNPPGSAESYMFYLAWFNHLGNAVLTGQDAISALRRGIIVMECAALPAVNPVKALQKPTQVGLALLAQLSNIPGGTPEEPGPFCTAKDMTG